MSPASITAFSGRGRRGVAGRRNDAPGSGALARRTATRVAIAVPTTDAAGGTDPGVGPTKDVPARRLRLPLDTASAGQPRPQRRQRPNESSPCLCARQRSRQVVEAIPFHAHPLMVVRDTASRAEVWPDRGKPTSIVRPPSLLYGTPTAAGAISQAVKRSRTKENPGL